MTRFSAINQELYTINSNGEWDSRIPVDRDEQLVAYLKNQPELFTDSYEYTVLMVHGFEFDPTEVFDELHPEEGNNPHNKLYRFGRETTDEIEENTHCTPWAGRLNLNSIPIAFGWMSNPSKWWNLVPFTNFYKRAYAYALESGKALARVIRAYQLATSKPLHIICHSLGSTVVRVALDNLDTIATERMRILILNGAEYAHEWERCIQQFLEIDTPAVYNVCVKADDVLSLFGENFGPKISGVIGAEGFNGACNIWLDDPATIEWGIQRGYRLAGDDPDGWLDHWESFTFKPNWQLYNAILNGTEKCEDL